MNQIRPIALYLPQFHPTPENDQWWGKGFTEWTNVAKAKPLFSTHYQPQLPADLGFYDLRLQEARKAQADLAKQYGIYGFCYYHYWFEGKRILQKPLDDILSSREPSFPFMLCWANETWSRRWLGEEKEILIKQTYSEKDDMEHAEWLCEKVFSDERYITVNNRPAFIFYRPHDLPDYKKTIKIFKDIAKKNGINEPYLIASNSHTQQVAGFDHVMNFEPQLGLLLNAFNDYPSKKKWWSNFKMGIYSTTLKVYDYKVVKLVMAARTFPYKFLPCVFVGWDNTARRGKNGIIIRNQNKAVFKASLENAKKIISDYPADEKIIFINAWNEWAEGNHLEPCSKYGFEYLNAVKEVFGGIENKNINR